MTEQRSLSITVLAWIFIIGSAFATFIALMQGIMVTLMMRQEETIALSGRLPKGVSILYDNFQAVFLMMLLVCLVMLVASVGLLKRKNWARRVVIGVLVLGMLWSIAAVALQSIYFSVQVGPQPAHGDFEAVRTLMQWFAAFIGLAVVVLTGWIVRKLMSAPVRREFGA